MVFLVVASVMDRLPNVTDVGGAALEAFVTHITSRRSLCAGTVKLEMLIVVEEGDAEFVAPLASETGWADIFTLAKSKKRKKIAERQQREFVLFFICKTAFAQSARSGRIFIHGLENGRRIGRKFFIELRSFW